MPLRRPKVKKGPEKLDSTPASPPRSPAEPGDIPVAKGSYTFDIDKWDDPSFNPFSSTSKMQESPKLPPAGPGPGADTGWLPSSSQDPTPAATPETPPVISAVVHATDEEKLAVTGQKWACVTVDLEADKQDFPQPSDLSSFVSETKFSSPTEGKPPGTRPGDKRPGNPVGGAQGRSVHLRTRRSGFESQSGHNRGLAVTPVAEPGEQEGYRCPGWNLWVNRPPGRCLWGLQREDRGALCFLRSSFEEAEALVNAGAKVPHLVPRGLAPAQEPHVPVPEKPAQELEARAVGAAAEAIEIREAAHPADVSISKSALYSRIGAAEAEKPPGLLFQPPDLDAALQVARAEVLAKEREVSEWKEKYEESRREVMEMRKIVAEYEKTIAQMIEDEQREKSVSHQTVQQLVLEKEQALADLNSVEKSLADLFRRYEKMKEVLEGFRKNEEVLKKCAQEYLSRVRKEEQRYQALKVHAEEKLDRANAEIAQVRGKAQQEQAASQASLRKEQLRVDALERTLEQKVTGWGRGLQRAGRPDHGVLG
ncbi:PREDICTED: transforming acidic coiled-coil-containing protein 2 [Myotis davidii]|uniref:transforming acidic coiled-coil-containing protein 2 n=1 Tax=Myotis davidii TaxID=225400 RepID=UPI000767BEF8|nr:PREDICTED: transforming acidic coiled-coil-containing protein 2 [Myotis davidii]